MYFSACNNFLYNHLQCGRINISRFHLEFFDLLFRKLYKICKRVIKQANKDIID